MSRRIRSGLYSLDVRLGVLPTIQLPGGSTGTINAPVTTTSSGATSVPGVGVGVMPTVERDRLVSAADRAGGEANLFGEIADGASLHAVRDGVRLQRAANGGVSAGAVKFILDARVTTGNAEKRLDAALAFLWPGMTTAGLKRALADGTYSGQKANPGLPPIGTWKPPAASPATFTPPRPALPGSDPSPTPLLEQPPIIAPNQNVAPAGTAGPCELLSTWAPRNAASILHGFEWLQMAAVAPSDTTICKLGEPAPEAGGDGSILGQWVTFSTSTPPAPETALASLFAGPQRLLLSSGAPALVWSSSSPWVMPVLAALAGLLAGGIVIRVLAR